MIRRSELDRQDTGAEQIHDWNPISETTGEVQSFETLNALGLQHITLEILSWLRGHNRIPATCPKILTYSIEEGRGYLAAVFKIHGDVPEMRTPSSKTIRTAKVIRFHGEPDHVRVRYMLWRQPSGLHAGDQPTELIDLLELDYGLQGTVAGVSVVKHCGADIANHIAFWAFDFSHYRDNLTKEPPIPHVEHPFTNAPPINRLQY